MVSINRITLIAIALIIVFGFAVYGNSLKGQFILDDNAFVKNNAYIKNWANVPKLFTQDVVAGAGNSSGSYRPVQMLSFMTDYSLWRLDAKGYHFTNIVLQILVSLMIYWFITLLFGNRILSLLTALFFVVHPVHTEVVAYIAGRADSLALLFMMLSFILYIKQLDSKNVSFFVLMIAAYVLSVLSRESSLILPLLILLYHYTFKKKIDPKLFFPILGIACFYFVLRFAALRLLPFDTFVFTKFFGSMPGTFSALTNYLRLLLLPFGLHHDYGKAFFRLLDPAVILGVVAFFSLLVYAFKKRESNKLVFFSVMWFFVALLPVVNISSLHAYMAECWLYISSIGFFLLLSKLLSDLYSKDKFRVLSITIVAVLLLFYSSVTIKQNNYWNDPVVFYKRTLKYDPDSLKARNNLANEYMGRKKFDEAIKLYKEAIAIDPGYEDAYVNLGNAYGVTGGYKDAISMYRKAIEIKPDDPKAWYNMANVYAFLGERNEAIRGYKKAIEFDPQYWRAYNKLGMIYKAMGRIGDSIELFQKSAEINPHDSWSYNSLGIAYNVAGNGKKAIRYFKKAVEIDPNLATAHYNLAIMYFYTKQYDLAVKHCNHAIALGHKVDPNFLKTLKQHRL
jgi:tetratricopeptide (TPR) repeat protein